MKKKLLLFAGLLLSAGLQAQNWQNNELPTVATDFYFYNVATGKWLQNNNFVAEDWTTRAQVGPYGLDIEVIPLPEGGYQLNPKFGHNHSINGADDLFYLDTNREVTSWTIQKKENGNYRIFSGTEENGNFLNTNDEGYLDSFGFDEDWILVTKEQRLADLATATKQNPKDATWLIGGHDFANQDERNNWDMIQEGDGNAVQGGDGIVHANRCWECWKKTNFKLSKTITGIPNGTYQFQLQGFYRDGSESGIAAKRDAGEEEIRATYYINDVTRKFKSILDSEVTEYDEQSYAIPYNGIYYPGNSDGHQGEWWGNAHNRASNCFFKGGYWNDPVEVIVSDGTLTIGMQKVGGGDDDWLLFDSFKLTYLGPEIDLGPVLANLKEAVETAEAYQGLEVKALTDAIATAKGLLEGTDAAAIKNATMALRDALSAAQLYTNLMKEVEEFDGVSTDFFTTAVNDAKTAAETLTDVAEFNEALKALRKAIDDVRSIQDPLKFITATIKFAEWDNVDAEIINNAKAVLEHAESADEIRNALNALRVARKIQKADKHADVFAGTEPADGDFYIYNVGQKRFLCGGGDWGAHAFVGFPGVKVTLIAGTEYPEGQDPFNGFKIDTHLNNGGENEYLNYGGYMDTGAQNLWEFVPVEGKTGVYVIARANGESNAETGERMLLGYRPGTYGNIDTDMYGVADANNQWKLVTEEERDELLKKATVENPQDATYKIASPNFSQREDISGWVSQYGSGSVWGRGENRSDFAFECWNAESFDLSQSLYDLLPGWYSVSVQGYYRDGDHWDQIRHEAAGDERAQAAALVDFTTETEVALPNILDEADKAPGLGDRRTTRNLIEKIDPETGEPVLDENLNPVMIEDPEGEQLYAGEFPYDIPQACEYFQNGLYKTHLLTEVGADGELMILVQKMRAQDRDWVVLDNFRLTYYGTEKPSDDQVGVKDVKNAVANTIKIYNLQGQQVKNAAKGFYIINGKKYIKK